LYNYHETDTYLDTSRLTLLRQIRVFKASDEIVVSKPGKAETMGFTSKGEGEAEDWTEGADTSAAKIGEGQMVTEE
jgi:translation machinery-associated protein 16